MKFTDISTHLALTATGTPTRAGSRGKIKVGTIAALADYPAHAVMISRSAEYISPGRYAVLDLASSGLGYDPSQPGDGSAVAQVETATAVGTVTTAGTVNVTITSNSFASPLVVSVAVKNTDTPSVWAARIRAALGRNKLLTSAYTVSGTAAQIKLTRIITPFGLNNDATLNIALAVGSAVGPTAAPTSANTTAGKSAVGVGLAGGTDNSDAEGVFPPSFSKLLSLIVSVQGGTLLISDEDPTLAEEAPEAYPNLLATTERTMAITTPLTRPVIYLHNTGSTTLRLELSYAFLPA